MEDCPSLPSIDQHLDQDDGYLSSALSSLDDSSDAESDIAELQSLVRSNPPASGSTPSVFSASNLQPRPSGRSTSMPPQILVPKYRKQGYESDVAMHDADRSSPEISLALLALRTPVVRQQAPSASISAILSSVAGLPRASPTAAPVDPAPSLGVRKQKRQRANSIEDSSMLAQRRVRAKTIATFDGSPDLVDPVPKQKIRRASGKARLRADTWAGASRFRDNTSSDESDWQSQSIVRSGSQELKPTSKVARHPAPRKPYSKANSKHTPGAPVKHIKKEEPEDDDMHAQISSDEDLSMFELDESDESQDEVDLGPVTKPSTSMKQKDTTTESQPANKLVKVRRKGSKKLFGHALLDYLIMSPDSELVKWSKDGKHLFFYDTEAFRKYLNATAGTSMSNFHSLYKQLRNYGYNKVSPMDYDRLKLTDELDGLSDVLVIHHAKHRRSNIAAARRAGVTSHSQSAKSKTRSASLELAKSGSVSVPKVTKKSRGGASELARVLQDAENEDNEGILGHTTRKSSSKNPPTAGRASLYTSARRASEPLRSPVRAANKLKQRIHSEKAFKRIKRSARTIKKASSSTSSDDASGSIDLDYLEMQQKEAARYMADMPDMSQTTRRELRFFRRARSPGLKCEERQEGSLNAQIRGPQEIQQLVIAKVEDNSDKNCSLECESKWPFAQPGTASAVQKLSEPSTPGAQDIDEPVVEKRVILHSTSSAKRIEGHRGSGKDSLQSAELPFFADTRAFCLRYAAATDLHSMRHRSDSLVSTHASDYDVAMTRAATPSVCHSRHHSRAWSITTAGTSVHAEDRDEEDKIDIDNIDANSLDGTPLHTRAQSALPTQFTESLRAMRVVSGISPLALTQFAELDQDVQASLEDNGLRFDEVLSNDTAMDITTKTSLDAEPRDDEVPEITPREFRDTSSPKTSAPSVPYAPSSQLLSKWKCNSASSQAPSLCPAEPFDPCPPVPARWLANERAGLDILQRNLAPSPNQITPPPEDITHFDGRWTQDCDGELFMSDEEVDVADGDEDKWEEEGIKQESDDDTSIRARPALWNELIPL